MLDAAALMADDDDEVEAAAEATPSPAAPAQLDGGRMSAGEVRMALSDIGKSGAQWLTSSVKVRSERRQLDCSSIALKVCPCACAN